MLFDRLYRFRASADGSVSSCELPGKRSGRQLVKRKGTLPWANVTATAAMISTSNGTRLLPIDQRYVLVSFQYGDTRVRVT